MNFSLRKLLIFTNTDMKTNDKIFKILIEEGFSKGNVSVFDTYSSPDFVEHQYGFFPPNVEGVKKAIKSLHYSFPDFSLIIEDIIMDGSKVWGRMTGRGTHKNKFGPMFPTGKKFEITVIDIMRFEAGKLTEHWGVPDKFSLMEQLGMKPPPKLIMKIMSLLNK
ncbi:MAG: ester cyclase [Bacteroidales bacterium]|jgi:predicted ester cyclase|nr:ester cyclase [Bacteroidales bacterium]